MPATPLTPNLWETVKCDFKGLFPEDVFQMWFEPVACVEATDDTIVLGVPNDFAAIWIHDNYLDLITQRLRLNAGRMVNVTFKKVDSAAEHRHAGKRFERGVVPLGVDHAHAVAVQDQLLAEQAGNPRLARSRVAADEDVAAPHGERELLTRSEEHTSELSHT
mgnify:CR=1 FL=1